MIALDLATGLTVLTALLFAWRVAATIRSVNAGEGAGALPAEGLHSDWPDDLRELGAPPRPAPVLPLPPLFRVSVYAQVAATLGFEP